MEIENFSLKINLIFLHKFSFLSSRSHTIFRSRRTFRTRCWYFDGDYRNQPKQNNFVVFFLIFWD